MRDEIILQKAIEKAEKNGWEESRQLKNFIDLYDDFFGAALKHKFIELEDGSNVNIEAIIFDHDFAKAFWGKDELCGNCGGFAYINDDGWYCGGDCEAFVRQQAWQYHLQQLVLEEEPLQYLAKFL